MIHARDLRTSGRDRIRVARATGDDGLGTAGLHLLALAEIVEHDVLQPPAEITRDDAPAGEDAEILHHRLSPMTVFRWMHDEDPAFAVLAKKRHQHLGRNLLRNNQQGTVRCADSVPYVFEFAGLLDLEIGEKDVGLVEHRLHLLDVGHHVVGDVAAIEGHALDHRKAVVDRDAEIGRDDAIRPDALDRFGDHAADAVVARRDRGDGLQRPVANGLR